MNTCPICETVEVEHPDEFCPACDEAERQLNNMLERSELLSRTIIAITKKRTE